MHVTDEMVDLIREAVRFAVQAAGDGFCAAESFLFNYSTASGDEDWETLADRVSAALRAAPAAEPQCCMCGKTGLSTVEGDGGSECQLSDGRWTCSFECWERATERAALTARAEAAEAALREMRSEEMIERVARAWATMDGKADLFDREKGLPISEHIDDPTFTGAYEGYMEEARELMRRSDLIKRATFQGRDGDG